MGDHEHLHADGTVHDHGTADLDHQHTGSGAVVWDQATGAAPAPDFDVPPVDPVDLDDDQYRAHLAAGAFAATPALRRPRPTRG